MGESTPGYSAGCQTCSPSSRMPPNICHQCWANRGAESTKHGEPEGDCSRRPGPCAFSWVTHLVPRRGEGERALLGRGAGWAPKLRWRVRLLSPHLGKYKVSKILPNYRKKSGSLWTLWCWTQWTGWSFKAYQCPIPSIKHTSRKNFPMWLFFGKGWRKWLCFSNQVVSVGRWRLGYRYHEGLHRCLGVSSGSDKQQYKSNPMSLLCFSDSSSLFQVPGAWDLNSQPAERNKQ